MALNYRRFSEEDLSRLSILIAGEYDFYVSEIISKKSKGGLDKDGNQKKIYDMLEVTLKIINSSGSERQLKDWIMIVQDEEPMGFKLRHFAATCGLIHKYDDGTLDTRDFFNKHGKVKIGVRDYTDQYGERKKQNSVIDYIKPVKTNDASMPQSDEFFNDDVPNFN